MAGGGHWQPCISVCLGVLVQAWGPNREPLKSGGWVHTCSLQFWGRNDCCVVQNRQLDNNYMDSKAPRLHVDLYTGPQAKTADLEICRRSDGSLWLLGEGACGKVYKVRLCQAAMHAAMHLQCCYGCGFPHRWHATAAVCLMTCHGCCLPYRWHATSVSCPTNGMLWKVLVPQMACHRCFVPCTWHVTSVSCPTNGTVWIASSESAGVTVVFCVAEYVSQQTYSCYLQVSDIARKCTPWKVHAAHATLDTLHA